MNISVLILTRNEEQNLHRCLDSVRWSDDVVVFDSFSTDRTVEIARASNARVYQHPFQGYGVQREAARTLVKYKYPWVFALDADEYPDAELIEEMRLISEAGSCPCNAFRMRRKDHFMGRWIRHATLYPSWFVRFYRHESIHYDSRVVHEYPIVNGRMGDLKGHLMHNNFSKGLRDWVCKHARYAELEAEEQNKALRHDTIIFSGLITMDPLVRRRTLKQISFRLACRPTIRFLYMYFFRMGCLDGIPGYHYCRLLAFYEYMIVLQMREQSRFTNPEI